MLLFITIVLPLLFYIYHLSEYHSRQLIWFPLILAVSFSVIAISWRSIGFVDGVNFGGLDAPAYKEIYEYSGVGFEESLTLQFYERGYSVLVWFFSRYVGGYEIFQVFIYACMFLMFHYYSTKLNKSYYSLFSLILLIFFIVNSFNTLRVIFAVFLAISVLFFLSDKKYLASLALFLLSFSIHMSSFVVFLFVFFNWLYNRLGFQFYIVVLFCSIFLSGFLAVFVMPVIIEDSRLVAYANQVGEISYGTITAVFVFIALILLRYEEVLSLNRYNRSMLISLSTFYIVVPIFYFYPIAYRLFLFYLPILFFLIPSILKVYSPLEFRSIKFLPLWLIVIGYIFSRIYIFYTVEICSAGVFLLGWYD